MKNYELLEHTADLGIRVKGNDLKDLFQNTASSLFDIIAQKEKKIITPLKAINIKEKGDNIEELLINWLNELISLAFSKNIIFISFEIKKISKNNLEAAVSAADVNNFKLKKEVKAATYHNLKVSQTDSGWQAEVIFDV